jgi:hypothetical protein
MPRTLILKSLTALGLLIAASASTLRAVDYELAANPTYDFGTVEPTNSRSTALQKTTGVPSQSFQHFPTKTRRTPRS